MRVLTWNVRGKLCDLHSDDRITTLLQHADVLIFTETGWPCCEPPVPPPPVPGFVCALNAPRPLQPHCGGVACYVRENWSGYTRPGAIHASDGIAWACLRLPNTPPISIAACYLPCESSNILNRPGKRSKADRSEVMRDTYTRLETDIAALPGHTIIVTGDFNARTGVTPEVDPTMFADWEHMAHAGLEAPPPTALFSQRLQGLPPRTSMDTMTNDWGRHLLSFCATTHLIIANGRLPGEGSNSFTYEMVTPAREARSTIDYFLIPPDLVYDQHGQPLGTSSVCITPHAQLPPMPSCKDDADKPFDHAPVTLCFQLPTTTQQNPAPTHSHESHNSAHQPTIKWDEHTRTHYVDLLRGDPMITAKLRAMADGTASTDTASSLLCEALSLAARKLTPPRKSRHEHHRTWFTAECKAALFNKQELAKVPGREHEARTADKAYRRLIRLRKRQFEQRTLAHTVATWRKHPRRFWQCYKGKRPTCPIRDINAWTTYFKTLFTESTGHHQWEGGTIDSHVLHHSSLFPSPTANQLARASCLNSDITPNEVVAALKHMHAHKAAGVDGVAIELLMYAQGSAPRATHVLAPRLANLFNRVMRGAYPAAWGECAVVPVYKGKGSPHDMDSYRGIAVGNAISKLFSTVVTKRMSAWAEKEGFRAAGQAGFRPTRGTPDNVFVLQHTLERARLQGRHVHAAFIDFRKAYDSVNRQLLWAAIKGMGVHGAMLDTLQRMHGDITMRVRLDGELGQPFSADMGVKQGDPLSPLLFGLFIDRCEQFLTAQCPDVGAHITPGLLARVLLYADDLVLLAYNGAGLQRLLDALHTFCCANHLTVNTAKSVYVTFGGGRTYPVQYDGAQLPVQNEFRYLGIPFSNTTPNPLAAMQHGHHTKATAAMYALLHRCREMGIHNVRARCNLFRTLVAPVLAYGCEVWSVYTLASVGTQANAWGVGSALLGEAVHKAFLRDTLQVPLSTTIVMMMSEVGATPLLHAWAKQLVGWWNRMVSRRDGDMVKEALRESLRLAEGGDGRPARPQRCWAAALHAFLRVLGRGSYSLAPISPSVLEVLNQRWQQHAWADWRGVADSNTHLRDATVSTGFKRATYRRWFCDEVPDRGAGWVHCVHLRKQIRALAVFRLGAHDLGINSMRFGPRKKQRSQRLCRCCTLGCVDDEYHVFECPAFAELRSQYPLLPSPPPYRDVPDPDAAMRQCMELEDERRWLALADYLIKHTTLRRRLLAACDADLDNAVHD